MAETTETREEREARWWAEWFEADYSWDGLAEKEILGGGRFGEQTLQDYWRRDPETGVVRDDAALRAIGELVQLDGRWWHLAHLPPRGERGAKTWKANLETLEWERLNALVQARLKTAIATEGKFEHGLSGFWGWASKGPDGRAWLDGVVLAQIGSLSPSAEVGGSSLSCRRSALLGSLDFKGAIFANGADFSGAIFAREISFDGAAFSGDAGFAHATFLGGSASFASVTFSGVAYFDSVTFFSAKARFHSAIFLGEARFYGATFLGLGGFGGATFSGDAHFERTAFSGSASFDRVTFSCDTRFSGAAFLQRASFEGANFSSFAVFEGANFANNADFDGVVFSGVSRFTNATFSSGVRFFNSRFLSSVGFGEVFFSGNSIFDGAIFSRKASFYKAKFSSKASFKSAKFSGKASFLSSEFSDSASFDGTTFSGGVSFYSSAFKASVHFSGAFEKTTRFDNAIFEGPVRFSALIKSPERDFAKAFYGTRFASIADFSGAVGEGQGARMAAAFAEAQFEKVLILTDGLDGKLGQVLHRALLVNTRAAARSVAACNAAFATLESGCRVVKIAMGKARDEVREQAYYRLQLRARQQRSDIGGWERAFGWLYGWASDYGSSFSRPLVLLLAMTVVFGLLYWGLGVFGPAPAVWCPSLLALAFAGIGWSAGRRGADEAALTGFLLGQGAMVLLIAGLLGGDPVWQGQKMALSAVFRPFATLAEQASKGAPAWPEAAKLGLHLIATVQSLLSGILIFLFGLAVKRRFQIS